MNFKTKITARLRVTYPMMFEITNPANGRKSHCGVQEFSSEEGIANIPYWVIDSFIWARLHWTQNQRLWCDHDNMVVNAAFGGPRWWLCYGSKCHTSTRTICQISTLHNRFHGTFKSSCRVCSHPSLPSKFNFHVSLTSLHLLQQTRTMSQKFCLSDHWRYHQNQCGWCILLSRSGWSQAGQCHFCHRGWCAGMYSPTNPSTVHVHLGWLHCLIHILDFPPIIIIININDNNAIHRSILHLPKIWNLKRKPNHLPRQYSILLLLLNLLPHRCPARLSLPAPRSNQLLHPLQPITSRNLGKGTV